jgi:DNA-binding NarL/FixJ family response regulator
MNDGFWCSSRVAKVLLDQKYTVPEKVMFSTDSPLTKQQVNVLQLLESGISNKEIARRLKIEPTTVKNHVHHILQKLQVNSRGEAAAVYRRVYHEYNMG